MKVRAPFKFFLVQKYTYRRTKWTGGGGPELHKNGKEWVLGVLKGVQYFYERGNA